MLNFWLILIAIALYGALHSSLASRRAKALAARWLGEPGRRYYRLFFSAQAAITFIPILLLVFGLPAEPIYTVPQPWRMLMLALQGACAAGILITFGQTGALAFLGLDALWIPQARQAPPILRTDGLYRWVRHPVYTLSLLALYLMPWMTWNWLALALGATLYITLALPLEESKLIDEFGEAYETYRQRVPALLPYRLPK
ncbi:MAG TPA: isoprenylcysteine carboxylmethyltransferase family protein [Anaerolineaceae bacterium]|nr:isoprenylcysteine carboxylmethyltransferase family protein [Anaerolineaceae bacterium]